MKLAQSTVTLLWSVEHDMAMMHEPCIINTMVLAINHMQKMKKKPGLKDSHTIERTGYTFNLFRSKNADVCNRFIYVNPLYVCFH